MSQFLQSLFLDFLASLKNVWFMQLQNLFLPQEVHRKKFSVPTKFKAITRQQVQNIEIFEKILPSVFHYRR